MIMPEPLVARFRADVVRLAVPEGRVGLAVSGGPDSLALLLLAKATLGKTIAAATVDHRLRPGSGDEAARVAEICASMFVPHNILKVEVSGGGEGVQGEARKARYAALAAWAEREDISTLFTAHHADDQAETLIMRLRRGAGLAGLSAIRPRRAEGRLCIARPLLSWRKAELVAIVEEAGLTPVDDPSNRDMRFDRAIVRRLLEERDDFDPKRIARSAAALHEADEALAWVANALWTERAVPEEEGWRLDVRDLPRAIRRRFVMRALSELHAVHDLEGRWQGREDVEPLLTALESNGAATLSGVLATGGEMWHLRPAPPRRQTS